MSREAAKKIVDLMIKHGAEQNALLAETEPICSDYEFQKYKRMIGRSMGSLLLDVINPIVELHPDLNHRSWNERLRLMHQHVTNGRLARPALSLESHMGGILRGRSSPAMFKRSFEFGYGACSGRQS